MLMLVAFRAVRNIDSSGDTRDWVNHTYSVIHTIERFQSAQYVAESATQAYVATGETFDLGKSNSAISTMVDNLSIIQALTRSAPDQVKQVEEIAALANTLVESLEQILTTRRTEDAAAAQALVVHHVGTMTSSELNRKISALYEIQLELLSERDTASYLQDQATRWTVWTGMGLYVLLMGGVVWLTWSDIQARNQAALTLQAAHDSLEVRVQERTAELASANKNLELENMERQWNNQALEHQLRYNHHIVDSISDLVFVLTKASNITRVNPAVLNQTGWESTDLVNKALATCVKLNIRGADSSGDPIARAMKMGRELRTNDAVVIHRDGKTTPVQLALFPLRDSDQVIGGVVTLQVISNQPEAKA